MKYRTEIVREGELLGPVDWDYPFLTHFDGWHISAEARKKKCDRSVAILRQISDGTDGWQVCANGYWYDVYSVGMYDGWPYWKPVPAVHRSGVLGPEWSFFHDLQDCRKKVTRV